MEQKKFKNCYKDFTTTVIAISFFAYAIFAYAEDYLELDQKIIDFIIANSEDAETSKAISEISFFGNIKVEGKASLFEGVIGTQTDKGSVGMVMTIPLLDKREKLERSRKHINTIQVITEKAVKLLKEYRKGKMEETELIKVIKEKTEYLEWQKKRVEIGVEYQMNFYKTKMEITMLEKTLHELQTNSASIMVEILTLVKHSARNSLKAMIEEK